MRAYYMHTIQEDGLAAMDKTSGHMKKRLQVQLHTLYTLFALQLRHVATIVSLACAGVSLESYIIE
jgi:predicted HicB family RNase H-like nuclease